MSLELRLRPEAEQDLLDAGRWYEQQRAGLGHEFIDEALAVLSTLAESPLLYPVIHRRTRRAIMHRFPFGIYYRVEKTVIVVVAIMHGSRNPKRWKSRI